MSVAPDELRRLVLRTLMPGFVGTSVPSWIDDAIAQGLASLCLYGSNVESPAQAADLVRDLRARSPRLLVAADEEGGDVTRLHYRTGSPYPGNAVLGRLDDVALTRAEAARIGSDLRAAGIDLDLAPVVDVNSSADNPVIGTRSFGADASLVARHAAAWVEGLQSAGVLACAKHFPGHGDTSTDSHHELPVVTASVDLLRARELRPFAAAVEAGAACVMTAAVVVPALDPGTPATFSRTLLRDVLRGELGFAGAIVTDALDMAGASGATGVPEAAVRALVAGCDLLCLGAETDAVQLAQIVAAVEAAVATARLPLERLQEAAACVERLQARRRPVAPSPAAGPVGDVPVAAAFELSDRARSWLAGSGPIAVVQVDTGTNLAVGSVPWGPAAVGLASDAAGIEAAPRVAVVGRSLGRGHPAWAVAEQHRAAGRDVVVVDCGWPQGGADIVTWGASPAVMRGLADLIGAGEP